MPTSIQNGKTLRWNASWDRCLIDVGRFEVPSWGGKSINIRSKKASSKHDVKTTRLGASWGGHGGTWVGQGAAEIHRPAKPRILRKRSVAKALTKTKHQRQRVMPKGNKGQVCKITHPRRCAKRGGGPPADTRMLDNGFGLNPIDQISCSIKIELDYAWSEH